MINTYKKLYSGKVRELYAIDDQHMLMVATDRISTFDVILNQTIPQKGIYLTQISLFWFKFLQDIVANHLTHIPLEDVLDHPQELAYAQGRSLVVKRLKPLPVEVIVRGYLAGTGYKDYRRDGAICGIQLPQGLQNAAQLPQPIFTPSTKAAVGDHDENITYARCANLIGTELTQQLEATALEIYANACSYAQTRGIIIADTKFEFGLDDNGNLILMDEVLTPDSSRFWDSNTY